MWASHWQQLSSDHTDWLPLYWPLHWRTGWPHTTPYYPPWTSQNVCPCKATQQLCSFERNSPPLPLNYHEQLHEQQSDWILPLLEQKVRWAMGNFVYQITTGRTFIDFTFAFLQWINIDIHIIDRYHDVYLYIHFISLFGSFLCLWGFTHAVRQYLIGTPIIIDEHVSMRLWYTHDTPW